MTQPTYTRVYKLKPGEAVEIDGGTDEQIAIKLERGVGVGQRGLLVVTLPRGRRVRKRKRPQRSSER